VRLDQSGGVSRLVGSTELAHQKLGIRPRFDLETGLREMLALDAQFRDFKARR
jgi:hypothetical protein